jgi:hypothetical protein
MTKPTDSTSKALDVLYGARPSEFVALRKKLAAESKSAGDRDASEKILAARRPTATAWAVNHVVRNNPDVVARFTKAVDALRGAQRNMLTARSSVNSSGSADRSELNEVIGELLALAKTALESEDGAWNPATQRRIATSLRTFPMATAENQNRFLSGVLEKDLDTADDDSLLQTTLGLADDEIDERPRHEHVKLVKEKKPHTRAVEPHEADRREDERRKKEEALEAKRAAEDLERRIRVRDRKADDLDRQAERLEARAREAEASAARARSLADAARRDAKKAREAKP